MKRFLPRLRAFGVRVAEVFPFTPLGLLLLGGAALALFIYGLREIDLILLIVGLVGLAVAALSLVTAGAVALGVWLAVRRRRTAEPLDVDCGYGLRTGFSLPRLWWVPLVTVRWTWVNPPAKVEIVRERGRALEVVTPLQRALRDRIVRRLEVADAFGFVRIVLRATEERTVRIAPSMGQLRQMHVVRSISGGEDLPHPEAPAEGDRADMRRYVSGDPIRYILWKVFARSRQLMVRTPERAISPVRQTCAYLVAGRADEAAAGAARAAVESGALGTSWTLGADGVSEFAQARPQAIDVLARSSNARPDEWGAGLAAFLAKSSHGARGRAVVFVPPEPGPWLERVMAAARASALSSGAPPVEFVVATDGIVRAEKLSLTRRLLLRGRTGPPREGPLPAAAEQLGQVVRSLGACRARVLIVDRTSGRLFSQGSHSTLGVA